MEQTTRERIWGGVRWLLIAASIAFGCMLVAASVLFGDCSFAGGRCPAEPGPLLEDDVFGIAAAGAALIVGPTVFLLKPGSKRFWIAIGAAAVAAFTVGLLARSMAHG